MIFCSGKTSRRVRRAAKVRHERIVLFGEPSLSQRRTSALGVPWRDRLDSGGQARALAMSQLQGYSDILSRILAGRGIGPETCEEHLDPSLRRLLPDPHCLQDMAPAAEKIARAIERGEKIAIFGDYDVDGACSSALLAEFLDLRAACRASSIFPTGSPKAMAPIARPSARSRAGARPCW